MNTKKTPKVSPKAAKSCRDCGAHVCMTCLLRRDAERAFDREEARREREMFGD